jgi:hypothetical protein
MVDNDSGLVYVDVTDSFFTPHDPLELNESTVTSKLNTVGTMHARHPVQEIANSHGRNFAREIRVICDVDVTTDYFPAEDII